MSDIAVLAYVDELGLHEGIVDVSRREENDREGDENVFIGIVERVGIVPAVRSGCGTELTSTGTRRIPPHSRKGILEAF